MEENSNDIQKSVTSKSAISTTISAGKEDKIEMPR